MAQHTLGACPALAASRRYSWICRWKEQSRKQGDSSSLTASLPTLRKQTHQNRPQCDLKFSGSFSLTRGLLPSASLGEALDPQIFSLKPRLSRAVSPACSLPACRAMAPELHPAPRPRQDRRKPRRERVPLQPGRG